MSLDSLCFLYVGGLRSSISQQTNLFGLGNSI